MTTNEGDVKSSGQEGDLQKNTTKEYKLLGYGYLDGTHICVIKDENGVEYWSSTDGCDDDLICGLKTFDDDGDEKGVILTGNELKDCWEALGKYETETENGDTVYYQDLTSDDNKRSWIIGWKHLSGDMEQKALYYITDVDENVTTEEIYSFIEKTKGAPGDFGIDWANCFAVRFSLASNQLQYSALNDDECETIQYRINEG